MFLDVYKRQIQRGIEDIKQGRTFKMRKDESLDDFLNRIEAVSYTHLKTSFLKSCIFDSEMSPK